MEKKGLSRFGKTAILLLIGWLFMLTLLIFARDCYLVKNASKELFLREHGYYEQVQK